MIRGLERMLEEAEDRHLAAITNAREVCALLQAGKVTMGAKTAAMGRVEETERAYLDALKNLGEANIRAARVILGAE